MGFVRTKGTQIVDGNGERLILRGYGHGDWMNPEPFMMGIPFSMDMKNQQGFRQPTRFDRARMVDYGLRQLCGSAYAESFWPRWMRAQLGEADIARMAQLGYNSVRLPLNAWHFMPEEPEISFREETFAILDEVLAWCEAHGVYAILDLHAAPGGQSGLGCDDGIDDRAQMFAEPESRERTIRLWEEIASRYVQREIIAGYDLLNEPLSGAGMAERCGELAAFYDELIPRIRRVDRNHMVMLEGSCFSMDLDIFDHDYDPETHNWCIATHFYGFSPQLRELYRFLWAGRQCGVPVWIGEGGTGPVENAVFYQIAEEFDMGYALWSWKGARQRDGYNLGVVERPLPEGWDQIVAYIAEGGPRPSYARAQEIFDELIENSRLEHCTVDETIHRYNTRRAGIELPAAGYDQGRPGREAILGHWQLGNPFGYRTENPVKLTLRDGARIPLHKVVFEDSRPERKPLEELLLELTAGEYVEYTIREVCRVSVTARALTDGAAIVLSAGGREETCEVGRTQEMTSCGALAVTEQEGAVVRLFCKAGTVQVDKVRFERDTE
ncbi:MAG: cellulase family glycosylhydrolase [Eubacteriales bacterium]|nr:cellulase family glycosylhydrolase [Eubacteriales bacterium]